MAEQKKILLVDFDDTICQSVFLKKVNDFLGTDYKIEQFKEYLIDSIVPEDRRKEFFASFFETDPYEKLPLIDGAKEALKKLSKKYDIYVCSSCVMLNSPKSSARLFSSKYEYLIKNLPFLDPKKFIFTSSKQLVKGDVVIDDYFSNLKGDIPKKFLFDSYHNKEKTEEELKARGVQRVKGWKEVCDILLNE